MALFRKVFLSVLVFAALLTAPSFTAYALEGDTVVEGSAVYNADKTVLIRYTGSESSFTVPETVTEIAEGAFENAVSLTSITLSPDLTVIGNRAFAGSGITGIIIPGECTEHRLMNPERDPGEEAVYNDFYHPGVHTIGDEAFAGCALTAVEFPGSTSSFGARIFSGCQKLTSARFVCSGEIQLGNGGEEFFKNCSSLRSVNFWGSLSGIGSNMFEGCSSLTGFSVCSSSNATGGRMQISANAFKNCRMLQSVTIPASCSVTSIGENAFSGCSGLMYFTLHDASQLTAIGDSAFYGTALKTADLKNADALAIIGAKAFQDCADLTLCPIPQSLISIGADAFSGCKKLNAAIDLPYLTSLGDAAFAGSGIVSLKLYNTLSALPGGSLKTSPFSGCAQLSSVSLWEGLTELPAYTFHGCAALETVTLPSTLTVIGQYAFNSAAKLRSVTLPEGLTSIGARAFYGCRTLQDMVFPSVLTEIGSEAFSSCDSLTKAQLPDSVTTVGEGIYRYCQGITSMELGTRTRIPDSFLANCGMTSVEIPEGIVEIGTQAFANCEKLQNVVFPQSLEIVGDNAFYRCRKLQTPDFAGSRITDIGKNAFWYCELFESNLTLPPRLTVLKNSFQYSGVQEFDLRGSAVTELRGAFEGWNTLTSVVIPGTVEIVGELTFFNCKNLQSVVLEEGVSSLGNRAFQGCEKLTSVTLPSTLRTVGYEAFKGCSALRAIELPDGLSSLGEYAFSNCRSLETICLPDGITILEKGTFEFCMSLSSIKLPDGLQSVGDYVFDRVHTLRSLTFPASLNSMGTYAFSYCPKLTSVIFQGNAPENASAILRRAVVDQEAIHIYYTLGAEGFEASDWDDGIFILHGEEPPAPPAPVTPVITFITEPELRHSLQDELLLWIEVEITPENHPEAPDLTPCGSLTMTVNGEPYGAYTQFAGDNTDTHRQLGWKMDALRGETVTVQFTLAATDGFASAQSQIFTGTIQMPQYAGDTLPLVQTTTPVRPAEPTTPGTPQAPDTSSRPEMSEVTPEEIAAAEARFEDISGHWGKKSIAWAYKEGLFAGTSETQFSPNSSMNRGMAVTVLYRLAKEPQAGEVAVFSDISDGAYYTNAIAWAVENGLVEGTGNGKYAPSQNITREQLITMLYRYACLSHSVAPSSHRLSDFIDSDEVSEYAREAMEWAVEENILCGKQNGRLDPKGSATRAEAAAILQRYAGK